MAVKPDKGREQIETTRISGAGNLDPSATIAVTISELVTVKDVLSVDVAFNTGAATDTDVKASSISVSGNDVSIDFVDEAGATSDADALAELIVTAKGF